MDHIIVLNLERNSERKKKLESQFKELKIENYTFFPAFDGKNIINMSFSVPIIKGVGMGRKLSLAEISIITSHIGALKYAQIMDYDNIVILEDDVVICDDWEKRLEYLRKVLPEDWEYCYLAGHSDYVQIPMYEKPTTVPAPKMVGAFSYLVNQKGIAKLIKYCGEYVTTYDDMITHKIEARKLIGYLHIPFMTYHDAGFSENWGIDSPPHTSFKYFKNKI